LEPHQVFYIASLFGWKRKDGTRRYRTSFKSVARKNAKTTECAGKAIYHLLADNEAGAQVYGAATKEDQARLVVNDAGQIIKRTPELKNKFQLFKYKNQIQRVVAGSSFMAALSSDSDKQDGTDPSWGIIDEYHEHKDADMLNVLESGMGSRSQPVIDIITTAGFHKEYPCYSQLRKSAIEILKGIKTDESFLIMIFEMDEGDDWKDEKNWYKSNPNLGVSVYSDYLQNQFLKACNEGGTKEVNFKTKNLNMWVDAADVWIQDDKYMACKVESFPDMQFVECFGGLDLAQTSDFSAFTLIWPYDNRHYSKTWYYIPEERNYDQRNEEAYKRWILEGWITETPGNVTDYAYIKADILKQCELFNVKRIAYDRMFANQLVIELGDEGVTMEPFGQGYVSMGLPTAELAKIIISIDFAHLGDPVLRWMFSNVALEKNPADNIKVHKGKSFGKVDGVVSNIMALGESMPKPKELNPYANKGITWI
jgi:phage terminase large subunit-like protein